MTLEEIIMSDATYCRDVNVTVGRGLGTVSIEDASGREPSIFLQGEEGVEFIDRLDALIDRVPDVRVVDAMKHLVRPYVDAIWS